MKKQNLFTSILTSLFLMIYMLSALFGKGDFAKCRNIYTADTVAAGFVREDGTVISSRFLELLLKKSESSGTPAAMPQYLYPGGDTFGVKISGAGVRVIKVPSGSENELIAEDRIEKINGTDVFSSDDVKRVLRASSGASVTVELIRDGKRMSITLTPSYNGAEYHLGAVLSDGASGIGTITFINPSDLSFGGLGHGICSQESGEVLNMTRGAVTGVILGGATRGAGGKPGELRGILTSTVYGSLHSNTECGVFGNLTEEYANSHKSSPLPVGKRDEVKSGDAKIISTVSGAGKKEYSIKIENVDYSSTGTKSFRIKITDSELIAATGGIVRGMSGSPIIQNGKLVGAVTHVMINDPTTGYGIFIENMLNAAENTVPKAA